MPVDQLKLLGKMFNIRSPNPIANAMVELRLHSYGPKTSIIFRGQAVEIGPDVFIAAEGAGTFEGVSVEKKVTKLLSEGKDVVKAAAKIHRESTRRGHASLTTSFHLQLEVTECSRALSMLLVAPPFGSYLQESQRRAIVSESSFLIPHLEEEHKTIFRDTIDLLYKTYSEMRKQGVELEDARYILPLCSKTSLFASVSLETYVGLMQLTAENMRYVPSEALEFAEKFRKLAASVAPIIVDSRLCLKNRLAAYPFPNPFKPRDQFFEKLVGCRSLNEPVMLSLQSLLEEVGWRELFSSQDKEVVDSLNPLLNAVFLEPLSLVAYHQAIRHRTVPTAVESIYTAASRAVQNTERNIIIPPDIKKSSRLSHDFLGAAKTALINYQRLLEKGCSPSSAVMVLPQALKIHVVRSYNGFNLLHPSGFVATRTCSYAQWEERAVAYKILHEVARKAPHLAEVAGEKCRQLGFCPEKNWCPIILKYHTYSDELHGRIFE